MAVTIGHCDCEMRAMYYFPTRYTVVYKCYRVDIMYSITVYVFACVCDVAWCSMV